MLFTNLSSRFVPVKAWQPMSSKHHVRLQFRRRFHRFHTVVGHVRFVSADLEKHGKHLGGVSIVIDNQKWRATAMRRLSAKKVER